MFEARQQKTSEVAYYGLISGLRGSLGGLGFTCPEGTPLPEILLDVLEVPADEAVRAAHAEKLQKLKKLSDTRIVGTEPGQPSDLSDRQIFPSTCIHAQPMEPRTPLRWIAGRPQSQKHLPRELESASRWSCSSSGSCLGKGISRTRCREERSRMFSTVRLETSSRHIRSENWAGIGSARSWSM